MKTKRFWIVAVATGLAATASLFGNGGAWQTGVPLTGNLAATDQKKTTNVTIEDEKLTIDLHQEFAAVEVRYRMKNTGAQVEQDFFFPVERWAEGDGEDAGTAKVDLENYKITADGTELKFHNVDAKGEKPKAEKDASGWGDFKAGTRLWKKSVIPFAQGQTREITIRYRSPYAANQSSVSDDSHSTEAYLRYSLSPAATWKGPIGKGTITVNCLHPRPEEVSIAKPKNRFKKVGDTQLVWEFQNLKPTLADDMKIVAHPAYDMYYFPNPETMADEAAKAEADNQPKFHANYVVIGGRYFLEHTDYNVTASSTLATQGEHQYAADNMKDYNSGSTWAEGVDGDGIGESLTLDVRRPLPLDTILIMPGYRSTENKSLWAKNNRVAELEITLNGEHTFTAAIPDEEFAELYPIPVRGYTKPVKNVKLVIKKVHRGTAARDTCISRLELRGRLSEKPKIHGAR
jgi:hypothetical protein